MGDKYSGPSFVWTSFIRRLGLSRHQISRDSYLHISHLTLVVNNNNRYTYLNSQQTSNSSSKTRGAAAPCSRITWASFLDSEEPSPKLLHLAELQRTNSSPISNCRHSKSAIFYSCNINYNINSLLWLRLGTCIIYII